MVGIPSPDPHSVKNSITKKKHELLQDHLYKPLTCISISDHTFQKLISNKNHDWYDILFKNVLVSTVSQ